MIALHSIHWSRVSHWAWRWTITASPVECWDGRLANTAIWLLHGCWGFELQNSQGYKDRTCLNNKQTNKQRWETRALSQRRGSLFLRGSTHLLSDKASLSSPRSLAGWCPPTTLLLNTFNLHSQRSNEALALLPVFQGVDRAWVSPSDRPTSHTAVKLVQLKPST